MPMQIIQSYTLENINAVLAKVELLSHPHRRSSKHFDSSNKKHRGKKYGYIIYVMWGLNWRERELCSFGYRIYDYKTALNKFNHVCACIRTCDKTEDDAHQLWISSGLLNEKTINLKHYGNKDYFPTFFDFARKNGFVSDQLN